MCSAVRHTSMVIGVTRRSFFPAQQSNNGEGKIGARNTASRWEVVSDPKEDYLVSYVIIKEFILSMKSYFSGNDTEIPAVQSVQTGGKIGAKA